jgi:putative tryptophan/tyrosine transport system substrate-binding protein
MTKTTFAKPTLSALSAILLVCVILLVAPPALAVDTIIIGDIQYKPVADIVAEIKSTLSSPVKVYATADVIGKLGPIVDREDARLVVALGTNALDEALKLPPSVSVIYGLIIAPPKTARQNVTGVYMSTPVSEYVDMISEYLPSLKKLSVVGSQDLARILDGRNYAQVAVRLVNSSTELLNAVDHSEASHALLLLPDVALLTSAVMEKVYLFSFRRNIPILGISEGNVKQGALFAIVFDPAHVGRQIGQKALQTLNGVDLKDMPPSPPQKYNVFLNSATAKKMGIKIPSELMEKAKRVYL